MNMDTRAVRGGEWEIVDSMHESVFEAILSQRCSGCSHAAGSDRAQGRTNSTDDVHFTKSHHFS